MSDIELELHFEDGRRLREHRALPLLIGRDPGCGLVLRTWRVARAHARLLRRENEIWVEDLGSLLGTTVNGVRVASHGPLQARDELVIGPCLIHVLPAAHPPEAQPARSLQLQEAPVAMAAAGHDAMAATGAAAAPDDLPAPDVAGDASTPCRPADAGCARAPDAAHAAHAVKAPVGPDALHATGVPVDPDAAQAVSGSANAAPGVIASAQQQALRWRLHEGLITALQLRRRDIGAMSDATLRAEATSVLNQLIAADDSLPADLDRAALVRDLVDEAVGLGPLEPLLADPGVTEIMVNRHDEIYVERAGRLMRDAASFSSEQALLGIIDRIVAPLGRRIDDSAPMVDARLRDGSRVNAVIAPIALRGASLTIRKFPLRRLTMHDLLVVGALDDAMAQFLDHCVRHRKNVIVSGGTGSGKTSLLNILSNAIPAGERIITIEDAAELRLNHAHLVSLEARPANLEGRGRVEIRDLVRNALRMRPDRIVVGECRGGEAFDMLAAMNTGHEGSLTTLHANSPRDALGRLETMILMAGMDLPLAAIREHVASSIDIIVQLVRAFAGRRLRSAIVQVTGIEGGRIQLQDLFLGQSGPPAVFTGCGLLPDGFNGAAALDAGLFSRQTVCQGQARLDGSGDSQARLDGSGDSQAWLDGSADSQGRPC